MAKNVAVGLLRPPHVFFYEVDCKKGKFRATKKRLVKYANRSFHVFSVFRTLHGYHIIGFPYRTKVFCFFKKKFVSDFTKKLRPRWNRKDPQVLRISEKWNLKTGRIVSPAPKFICGNLKLDNIQNYKVLYYAK
jgi:hypothetical protein